MSISVFLSYSLNLLLTYWIDCVLCCSVGKALPGLSKQDACCGTVGHIMGFHKCQKCPKRTCKLLPRSHKQNFSITQLSASFSHLTHINWSQGLSMLHFSCFLRTFAESDIFVWQTRQESRLTSENLRKWCVLTSFRSWNKIPTDVHSRLFHAII